MTFKSYLTLNFNRSNKEIMIIMIIIIIMIKTLIEYRQAYFTKNKNHLTANWKETLFSD